MRFQRNFQGRTLRILIIKMVLFSCLALFFILATQKITTFEFFAIEIDHKESSFLFV